MLIEARLIFRSGYLTLKGGGSFRDANQPTLVAAPIRLSR
jgi:hypothetical protein